MKLMDAVDVVELNVVDEWTNSIIDFGVFL